MDKRLFKSQQDRSRQKPRTFVKSSESESLTELNFSQSQQKGFFKQPAKKGELSETLRDSNYEVVVGKHDGTKKSR